ncbi:hypothetical protein [Rhizobium laguerreae]|uniref:hypothetical protein n=1 Tax=Rhizobium laguerreae TaxID=1076926 RepID=UPI001C923DF4|nr:hypothetical protein [Rhizobium laguerreae]
MQITVFMAGFMARFALLVKGAKSDPAATEPHPSDESIAATNVFETSWRALEIRSPFSGHKSRIAD